MVCCVSAAMLQVLPQVSIRSNIFIAKFPHVLKRYAAHAAMQQIADRAGNMLDRCRMVCAANCSRLRGCDVQLSPDNTRSVYVGATGDACHTLNYTNDFIYLCHVPRVHAWDRGAPMLMHKLLILLEKARVGAKGISRAPWLERK